MCCVSMPAPPLLPHCPVCQSVSSGSLNQGCRLYCRPYRSPRSLPSASTSSRLYRLYRHSSWSLRSASTWSQLYCPYHLLPLCAAAAAVTKPLAAGCFRCPGYNCSLQSLQQAACVALKESEKTHQQLHLYRWLYRPWRLLTFQCHQAVVCMSAGASLHRAYRAFQMCSLQAPMRASLSRS